MRNRGCANARTIHSLNYRPRGEKPEKDTGELQPAFAINRASTASKARLIIVDECSMVDEKLGRDLLSFGTKVLVLGDPGQLPPVSSGEGKGAGFFTDAEPDVMLTEVHRQAKDNPIIHLSMMVREGGRLESGSYGESRIIRRREIDAAAVMAADQVLVGLNKTRRLYNTRLRELNGYRDPMPAAGEKLVCLRNDKTKGLLNGGTWTIQALRGIRNDFIRMDVVPDDDARRRSVDVSVHKAFFEGTEEEVPFVLRKESDEFTYGYALTVHKAQGSQWDDLVLFDESYAFREHRSRWLYTALTRAAEKITVVI
jgi:exodeoxyribonuclease-5